MVNEQPTLPGLAGPSKTGKKVMDPWMLEQIKAAHPEAFGHHAHWRYCRCGAIVLNGADWTCDWAGVYDVDPAYLDTMTEIAALVAGRRTFEVIIKDDSKTLRSRDPWRIRAHSPESVADPVAPLHRCNDPIGVTVHPRQFIKQEKTP